MAVMTSEQRAAARAELMRDESRDGNAVSITKADLRAAVDAADAWADANAASFNTAIPQPARGALTSRQKAMLLAYVLRQRYNVGA